MEIDEFKQFKMKTILDIWNCGDPPGSTPMAELLESFKKEAKLSFGMDEAASVSLFSNLVEESSQIKRKI